MATEHIAIDDAKSQAFHITLMDGTTYAGFIIENLGTLIAALLYSRIDGDKSHKVNDTKWGTEWRIIPKQNISHISKLGE